MTLHTSIQYSISSHNMAASLYTFGQKCCRYLFQNIPDILIMVEHTQYFFTPTDSIYRNEVG